MSRKLKSKKTSAPVLHCLNKHAAGVDVGASEIWMRTFTAGTKSTFQTG